MQSGVLSPGELAQVTAKGRGYAAAAVQEFQNHTPEEQALGVYISIDEFGVDRDGKARTAKAAATGINGYAAKSKLAISAVAHNDVVILYPRVHVAKPKRNKPGAKANQGQPAAK